MSLSPDRDTSCSEFKSVNVLQVNEVYWSRNKKVRKEEFCQVAGI